jgi:hypothetical protein
MRILVLALALCFSLAPLGAAATTHAKTKVKKSKVKGHKAPKRKHTTA